MCMLCAHPGYFATTCKTQVREFMPTLFTCIESDRLRTTQLNQDDTTWRILTFSRKTPTSGTKLDTKGDCIHQKYAYDQCLGTILVIKSTEAPDNNMDNVMEQSWRTHHECWTYNNIYVGVAVCPPRIPIWPLPRNDVVEQVNWSPLIYMYSHCRVKSMMNMATEAPMTPSYGHWSPDNTHIWPLKPRYIGAYQYDHRLPVTTDRLLSTKVTPFKSSQNTPKHKPQTR